VSLAVAVVAAPARADDEAEARKTIDRAIQAHGGAAALGKYSASTTKFKGHFRSTGVDSEFTGSVAVQFPDRIRLEMTVISETRDFTMIHTVNGDKGWASVDRKFTVDMSKEEVTELREALHLQQVGYLVCLSGKDYKLASAGEVTVAGRPALGVLVQCKDRRDIKLFFDKESNLLVKTEVRGNDPLGRGKELVQEIYHRAYKKVGGVTVAHKLDIHQNGKLVIEREVTEYTPSDKLDDTLFTRR
jgi:hypothetical protein